VGGEEEGAYAQGIQGHQQTSGRGKELTIESARERDVLSEEVGAGGGGHKDGGYTQLQHFQPFSCSDRGRARPSVAHSAGRGTLPMDGFHFVAVLQFISLAEEPPIPGFQQPEPYFCNSIQLSLNARPKLRGGGLRCAYRLNTSFLHPHHPPPPSSCLLYSHFTSDNAVLFCAFSSN
jgi:hypothetical protein